MPQLFSLSQLQIIAGHIHLCLLRTVIIAGQMKFHHDFSVANLDRVCLQTAIRHVSCKSSQCLGRFASDIGDST